jgi:hypothetical protein
MISRRDFSIRLAGIAGIAAAGDSAHLLEAQESAAKNPAAVTTSSPVSEEGLSPAEQAEVESRYQNVIRRWGDRLSNEQRQRVHRVLVANARMMQPMQAFQLENGDPPAEVLRITSDDMSANDGQKTSGDRPE